MKHSLVGSPAQHHLFSTLLGPIHWHLLEFAFEHQLFDQLHSRSTATDIARQRSWCPERLALLLNAYVALGVLTKQQGNNQQPYYQIATGYPPYLLSGSKHYLGTTLCHLAKVKACSSARLTELIARSEHPVSDSTKQRLDADTNAITHNKKSTEGETCNMRDGHFWQHAITGLLAFHQSTRNPILLPLLSQHPDWRDGLCILDVGAGSLQLAENILVNHPNTQLTLFDLPACCDHLRQQLVHSPHLNKSVTLRAGDMNHDDFGCPYHLILASMSLYFSADLQQCINRLWQSLAPGGLFVSFHEALDSSRTQPAFHILGRLPAELANGPLSLEQGQVEAALTANDPISITSEQISTPFGDMTLIIAKKPD
ncbi:methyltransferase [Photobacterium nomapromontoriensis]|uniref:methyltransferase n=1 Tax=Photobacterium nomapromontoriensis TaxID=2910237 RepID=UPI003D09F336